MDEFMPSAAVEIKMKLTLEILKMEPELET